MGFEVDKELQKHCSHTHVQSIDSPANGFIVVMCHGCFFTWKVTRVGRNYGTSNV